MSPEKYHTQIEAWLTGDLNPEEAKSFEAAMKNDAALATAVKEQEVALEAIDLLVEESLSDKLKVLQEERYSKSRSIGNRSIPLAIAASLVILIATGFTFWMNQKYSNQQLATSNFEVWDDGVRGQNTGWDSFTNGDYEQAINELEVLSESDPNYLKAQFYLGQSHFQLKNYKNALSFYERIIQSNDPRFANHAKWFSGLAYLGMEELDNAKAVFEELKSDSSAGFDKKAATILKDLDSFWRFGN